MIPDISQATHGIGQVGLVVDDLKQAMDQFRGLLELSLW